MAKMTICKRCGKKGVYKQASSISTYLSGKLRCKYCGHISDKR